MSAFKSTRHQLKTAEAIRKLYDQGGVVTNLDVSELECGGNMFLGTCFFNQDIGDWDVSSMTNAERMFYGAEAFNQDLSNWAPPMNCNFDWAFDRSGMPFIAEHYQYQLRFIQFKNSILIQSGCRYFRAVEDALAHWNPKTHHKPKRANLFSDAIRERAAANLRD